MGYLSKDSYAILLLCSDLGLNTKDPEGVKPYTLKQWNRLSERIMHSTFKRPEGLFTASEDEWKKELYIGSQEVERIKALLSRSGQLGIELEHLNSLGVRITTRAEQSYPKRLKEKLKKDSPPIIYYSGNIDLLSTNGVAVVGSRNIDEKGIEFTRQLAQKATKEGLTIISGGAKGVDAEAQNTALKAGGKVISFLSDSLSRKIKEKETREYLINEKLLLMSTVNPKAHFTVYSAMDRNKYIYALSDYAIVVSSDYEKGGTWTGAIENLENKWVHLFVRNDKDIPKGNTKLLEKEASEITIDMVTSNNSLLTWLNQNHTELKKETKEVQLDIFSQLQNNYTQKEQVAQKVNEEITEDYKKESYDIYPVIWPFIKGMLMEPKSPVELVEALNIRKVQLDDWLNRAINEGEIKKLSNPVRYVVNRDSEGE